MHIKKAGSCHKNRLHIYYQVQVCDDSLGLNFEFPIFSACLKGFARRCVPNDWYHLFQLWGILTQWSQPSYLSFCVHGLLCSCALANLNFNHRAVTFLTQFSLIWGTCCSIVIIILLKFSSCSNIGVFKGSRNYKIFFDSVILQWFTILKFNQDTKVWILVSYSSVVSHERSSVSGKTP